MLVRSAPFRYSFTGCCLLVLSLACGLTARAADTAAAANNAAASEARLSSDVGFLASDEREGRGIGTQGLDQAADYIAQHFKALGLKTEVIDGQPFQRFKMTLGAELGEINSAEFLPPQGKPEVLKLGKDFTPLAMGSSGSFTAPLVFVGYGITAKDLDYDDYAGLDVKDKAVIVLRHEPQQDNPHSGFNGDKHSDYAPFMRKVSNAYEHGAAAVIFCTDDYEIHERIARKRKLWEESIDELAKVRKQYTEVKDPPLSQIEAQRTHVDTLLDDIRKRGAAMQAEFDPLMDFQGAGPGDDLAHLPVLFCRRALLDPIVKQSLGKDLATLEQEIDQGPKPHSAPLEGWQMKATISVKRTQAEVKNVVAVLEGEGPHADETIVIGAHYDHLGLGGSGSLAPGSKEIHNGADDNASGVTALLEIAKRLAASGEKLPRRIVFIAFTGEERGLIGSAKYVNKPVFPLDKTVAMLNLDMVGRLTDDKLIIQGLDTADEFTPLVDRLNERYGFKIKRESGGFGPSDHSSFYGHKIPVMHFFTGIHLDYHRPGDDVEKLNIAGMRRVAELVADVAVDLAKADGRPGYKEIKSSAPAMGSGGDRPHFGSIPDFGSEVEGYAISGVSKDSPAAKAGVQGGDVLIRLGDSKIGNLADFDSALRKHKAGQKVPIVVRRDGKDVELSVTLGEPR